MAKVTCDMSMSLDGYIAGPRDDIKQPLGECGERLHEWVYTLESWRRLHGLKGGEINSDSELLEESIKSTGAVVMGRRMFSLGERYWGHNPPFHNPVFILTHESRSSLMKEGGTTYTFFTGKIEEAIKQAKEAAQDKNVSIAGGANVLQQCLERHLVDELQIHLVPVLLGNGRKLFEHSAQRGIELRPERVVASPSVTHIRYRIIK
jgi:dihydrofolate reductase